MRKRAKPRFFARFYLLFALCASLFRLGRFSTNFASFCLYLRGRLCALSFLCQRIEDYGKHVLVF